MAALLLCAAGCQQKLEPADNSEAEQETLVPSNYVQMTFRAESDGDAQVDTKTVVGKVDGKNLIYWNATDAINVFDINPSPAQGAKFTILSDDPSGSVSDGTSTSANFIGQIPESETGYYAVYPYKDYTNTTDYGFSDADGDGVPERFVLDWEGQIQNPSAGSFDSAKALMIAKTTKSDNYAFNFMHLFSYIKLTTEFSCEKIVISANEGCSDRNLTAQDLYVEWQGSPTIVTYALATSQDGQGDAVICASSDEEYLAPGTYLVAVMPRYLSKGLTITFNNIKGADTKLKPSKTTANAVTLTRGKVINLGTFTEEFIDDNYEFDGDGTENNPYLIEDIYGLQAMATRVNAAKDNYPTAYYKLTADLNADGTVLTPVGASEDKSFKGVFDGDNHTISDYVSSCQNSSTGLFGYVKAGSAKISNLTVKPRTINDDSSDGDEFHAYSPLVGITCTDNKADVVTIENCKVSATDSKDKGPTCGNYKVYFGSIVGLAKSGLKITGCTNNMGINISTSCKTDEGRSDYNVGGIVGAVAEFSGEVHCTFNQCVNNSEIVVNNYGDTYVGGIVGLFKDAGDVIPIVANSINRGYLAVNLAATDSWMSNDTFIGGIVGWMDSDGYTDEDPYVINCLNRGVIYGYGRGDIDLGGIIGKCYDDDTHVINCAGTSKLASSTADAHKGALCGSADGTYLNCKWVTLSGEDHLPIVYDDSSYSTATNCGEAESISYTDMNTTLPAPSDYGLSMSMVQWTGSTADDNLSLYGL